MLVREMKKLSREFHRDGLVAIEREEPNAWASLLIVDVSANIQFHEIGKPGEGGKKFWSDLLHEKGDETEVGFAFVEIDLEAVWKAGLDEIRFDLPMQKEEIAPSLEHHRKSVGPLTHGESVLKGWKAHRVSGTHKAGISVRQRLHFAWRPALSRNVNG